MKLLTAFLFAVIMPAAAWADDAAPAASAWLTLVDGGHYGQSWKEAASLFQNQVSSETWTRTVRAVRDPLGPLVSRGAPEIQQTTTLPGAPDGHYTVLHYATQFRQKPVTAETVVLAMEGGQWKVAGYFLK